MLTALFSILKSFLLKVCTCTQAAWDLDLTMCPCTSNTMEVAASWYVVFHMQLTVTLRLDINWNWWAGRLYTHTPIRKPKPIQYLYGLPQRCRTGRVLTSTLNFLSVWGFNSNSFCCFYRAFILQFSVFNTNFIPVTLKKHPFQHVKSIRPGHTLVWSGASTPIELKPPFITPSLFDIVQGIWHTRFHIFHGITRGNL